MSTANTPSPDSVLPVIASSSEATSPAPVAPWYEDDHRGHVVQFYSEDNFLLDDLSRFVGTALGGGDSAIVIATKAHRDGLVRRLRARGFDTASAAKKSRYLALDAAQTLSKFMVDGSPDGERFVAVMREAIDRARTAAEGENPRVVAFGEMVAILWADGNSQGALRLEQLWNELARSRSFSLRCAYPIAGFNRADHGEAFLQICGEHATVIPGESYTRLDSEDAKLRNVSQLQQKAQALETEKAERTRIQQFLQNREADLAEILENAVEGVQQVGPDQRILWANRALLKLLGYSSGEYFNHPLADFHADKSSFEEFWQRLMKKEDIYDYPAELRCKDGSIKSVVIHSNGLWEDGKFVHTRCFVRDVTEQKRMEQALRDNQDHLRRAKEELESLVEQRTAALRRLSSQVLSLQDLERRRLARELHDSLGQYLVGLKLNVDVLRQSPENSELWQQSEELMERCITEVRTLSYLLHPPMMDEAGLASAAQWYVDGFGKRSGLKVALHSPEDLDRLPDSVEVALFRVLQEALTNVHRHSRATSAEVRIERAKDLVVLEVSDNGRGIPQENLRRFHETGTGMGVGLTGMRERVRELGGTLELACPDGGGTLLRITAPVK